MRADEETNNSDSGDTKWGLIVVLAFLLGVPILGVLASLIAH
jgi:hypothetical protein